MLNMIKMDLYRMFRTKSMYVVWIVLAVSVLFTTFMCKIDYDSLSKKIPCGRSSWRNRLQRILMWE